MKKGVRYFKSLTKSDFTNMSQSELNETLKIGKKILTERYKKQKSSNIGKAPIWKGNNPYSIKTKYRKTAPEGMTQSAYEKSVQRKEIAQLTRIVQLLNDQTTTVRGYQTWLNRQSRALDESLTESEIKKIWRLYDKINESHTSLTFKVDYRAMVKSIAESVKANYRVSYSAIDKSMKSLLENTTGVTYSDEEWNNV